jgi:hypothetical protein
MKRKILSRDFLLSDLAILCYFALFKLVLHLLTHQNYGYFRDEFYYIACSKHLAFGYVDQPPLSIFVLAVVRSLFGDSLFALHLIPALTGAFVVFFAGLIARELGGSKFAQALAVIITPAFLSSHGKFSMNPFDHLFWILAAYIVILIITRKKPQLWLLFGLVAGLGLMNKYSMLFIGFGLVIGLLLTSQRKQLLTKWIWLALLIAFVIFLPHIIWEIKYDFPSFEFMYNASQFKNVHHAPLEFFLGQIDNIGNYNAPIWLLGLYYYIFHKKGKEFRFIGLAFVSIFILMVALKAKIGYLAPAFPMLLAPGALMIEKIVDRLNWNWLKPILMVILILNGILTAPFAMPVLPVKTFIKYATAREYNATPEERHEMGVLPQHFADMFGWKEMASTVAQVYKDLSPEEQSSCSILTSNYGEAGAIDFYGKEYGLPKVISGHNNYWLWGPGDAVEVVISLTGSIERLSQYFESVEQAAVFTCKYCMPYENNRPIYVCRNPKFPVEEVWPQFKHYD